MEISGRHDLGIDEQAKLVAEQIVVRLIPDGKENCLMVGFQIAWCDDWCPGVTLSQDSLDVTP